MIKGATHWILGQHGLEIVEKILAESSVFGVVRLQHGTKEPCDFFSLDGEVDGFTCGTLVQPGQKDKQKGPHAIIKHLDIFGQRFIRRRKHDTLVLQRSPLRRPIPECLLLLPPAMDLLLFLLFLLRLALLGRGTSLCLRLNLGLFLRWGFLLLFRRRLLLGNL